MKDWRREGLLLLLLASGCVDYLPAISTLATGAAVTHAALAPLPRTARELCRARASFDLWQARLESAAPWGSTPSWSRWFDERVIEPADGDVARGAVGGGKPAGLTWAQHCQRLDDGSAAMRASLQLFADYTALLQATLQSGYSGNAVRQSAAALGTGLGPYLSFAGNASALGSPLTQLADLIIKWRGRRRFAAVVGDGAAIVARLIEAQKEYLRFLDNQAYADERGLGQLVDHIDRHSSDAPPIASAALFAWSERDARRLRWTRDRLATYGRVIDALGAAHRALADATRQTGNARRQALDRAIGSAAQAQAEIAWLHETIAQEAP